MISPSVPSGLRTIAAVKSQSAPLQPVLNFQVPLRR